MSSDTTISDFALLSHVAPGLRIVGIDLIKTINMTSWEHRLVEHVKRLKTVPELSSAKLVVFVEGNMKTEAQLVKRILQREFPATVFPGSQGNDDLHVGVLTTNQTKHDQAHGFQLALLQGAIQIARHLICTDGNPEQALNELRTQLLAFSRFAIPGKNPLQATRFKFTGKGTSMTKKDDAAIVAQMGLHCSQRFFTTSEWCKYM